MESYKRTGEGRESEGMGGTKLNNNKFRTTLMLGLHDMSESQKKKKRGGWGGAACWNGRRVESVGR